MNIIYVNNINQSKKSERDDDKREPKVPLYIARIHKEGIYIKTLKD